jgi:hypothetical protein
VALRLLPYANVPDARRPSAVRVLAPDARHLDSRAMHALGVECAPRSRRATQLDRCRHMVAVCGAETAGFAAFELTDSRDLLVHELSAAHHHDDATSALVTALELACLAAGGTRLLISNRVAMSTARLAAYGYEPAPWNGCWQKSMP